MTTTENQADSVERKTEIEQNKPAATRPGPKAFIFVAMAIAVFTAVYVFDVDVKALFG